MASLTKACAIFGWDVGSVPAIVSCAQQDPSFPAARLLYDSLFSSFQTLSTLSGVQIVFQMAAPTMIQGLVLVGTNFTMAATRKLELTASDPTFASGNILAGSDTSPVAAFDDSNPGLAPYLPPWGWPMLILLPNPIGPFTYGRITISDPTNGAGFLSASILRAGPIWQPKPRFPGDVLGANFDATTWAKNDNIVGDPGAQLVLRGHDVTFHRIAQIDEATLFGISRNLKQTGRLMLVPQAGDTSTWLADALWCVFEQGTGGASNSNSLSASPITTLPGLKAVQISFREVNR